LATYIYFYKNNKINKDNLKLFLKDLVNYYNYEEDEIYTAIAEVIIETHLFELMDLVKKLYQDDLIDTIIIGDYADFVDDIFKYGGLNRTQVVENTID